MGRLRLFELEEEEVEVEGVLNRRAVAAGLTRAHADRSNARAYIARGYASHFCPALRGRFLLVKRLCFSIEIIALSKRKPESQSGHAQ
mmetsp:Transcript_23245/g.57712  ORF Transcript_23245/g.57712 Transcript_23245/m.57712 type:complete len:88 (-) Transcript_23245:136-399(-)